MNSFLENLKISDNFVETENGGLSHKSTLNAVYDLFALGGAYRSREDNDCILLFKKAFEQDKELALKCLFYLRDIRGGQGERRFFRVCFRWLAQNYPEIAKRNLINIAEYGRYDDLYCVVGTTIENDMFEIIAKQLQLDMESVMKTNEGVSLLAKWLKSENASSKETKELGNKTRIALGLTHKKYRQILSQLRTRINIVEKLMSENRWEEIEFDKIPSKAGLIYRNAFAHRDIIAKKYEDFINSKETKVNASALYPYDIVDQVVNTLDYWGNKSSLTATKRETLNKYWSNLKDYFNGKKSNLIVVADTSGSMTCRYGNNSTFPINIAISLALYTAERLGGPFYNHFISFSSRPQLIETEGIDFVDKVSRIYKTNLCENTDIGAVFDLLKKIALMPSTNIEDVPDTIVIISDMEIDEGSYWRRSDIRKTEIECIRREWEEAELKMPKLVYWNVNARDNLILDGSDDATFVSGCSPVIFESILTGKTGWDLCYEKLMSDRYVQIK